MNLPVRTKGRAQLVTATLLRFTSLSPSAGREPERGVLSSKRAVLRYASIGCAAVSLALAFAAAASEIRFDFGAYPDGRVPQGFTSLVSGPGQPDQWKTEEESVAPLLGAVDTNATIGAAELAVHGVLAASSTDAAPNRAGLLLFTNELFGSFTLTTKFKINSGSLTPEAGIAFRVQDESNYYVIRASTQGNLLWYRVVGGVRYDGQGIGVRVPVAADTWHELRLECSGNSFRGFLNGRLLIPPIRAGAPTNDVAVNDNTFSTGKIGFWAAADTAARFTETKVVFTERVPLIQTVVASVTQKYPRMLGLTVYAMKDKPEPVVVADAKPEKVGEPGEDFVKQVLRDGQTMYLKTKQYAEVTQPLRDRNGDVIAAVKTRLTTFPGETRDTALMRATQIRKALEEGLATLDDINN